MHAALSALRTTMDTCSELLGAAPAAAPELARARAELDRLSLDVESVEQFDDGDSVH